MTELIEHLDDISIEHNLDELISTILEISDSTIAVNNYTTLANPQHISKCEILSLTDILVEDNMYSREGKKLSLSFKEYVYYLTVISKVNDIRDLPQVYSFYNEDIQSFGHAFITLFFDQSYKRIICEPTNICTAVEVLGYGIINEEDYYYNWYNDTLIKGSDLFAIGIARKHEVVWH